MNSSIACRYPRFDSGERRLSRTADLLWSRSGRPSFVFGRFGFEDFRLAYLLIPAASTAAGQEPMPARRRVGRYTSISNTVSPVKHFLRHTTASAAKSAPFRFHGKLRAIINQRLACNLAGGTQSDPTISPVATSIMITTSNSLRRERDAQSSGR